MPAKPAVSVVLDHAVFPVARRTGELPTSRNRGRKISTSAIAYVASAGRSFGASLIGRWMSAAPTASMMSMYQSQS